MTRQRASIRRAAALLAMSFLTATAGCNYQPAPPPPSSSTTNPAASGTAPGAKPSPQTPTSATATPPAVPGPGGMPGAGAAPPGYPAATPAAPTSTPAAPANYSVQLSAGVATPLPTVEGTKIGFSVDYQYSAAGTSPTQAVWVIQRAKGNPARLKVPLQASGTLQTLLDWPPDEGPYQCRIEDPYGRQLSADAPMKSPGL